MTTAADAIADRSIRHAVFVSRFSGGEVKRLKKLLEKLEDDIVAQLINRPIGSFKTKRLKALQKTIQGLIEATKKEYFDEVIKGLEGFSKQEAAFTAKMLNESIIAETAFTVPSSSVVKQLVRNSPINGKFISEWANNWSQAARAGVNDAITKGLAQGEGVQSIVRRIRGTRASGYTDGVSAKFRRNAEVIVRTSVNNIHAQAREETYRENKKFIRGVRWVSTLDSRTSKICISLDGKEFEIGKGPRPPAHPNCRSTTVPILKNSKLEGKLPPRVRASKDGPIADQTAEAWLKRQPNDVQNKILGPTRARAFREGFPLGKFVDDQQRVLTLDELAVLDEEMF